MAGLPRPTKQPGLAGFGPRELGSYLYFCIRPDRVQAWLEVNEPKGRELMRDGRWTNAN